MSLYSLISLAIFGVGAYLILLNYYCYYLGYARGEHHSPVPFLGCVLCSLALFILPVTRSWFWLPLFVDPGSAFLLVLLVYSWMREP